MITNGIVDLEGQTLSSYQSSFTTALVTEAPRPVYGEFSARVRRDAAEEVASPLRYRISNTSYTTVSDRRSPTPTATILLIHE